MDKITDMFLSWQIILISFCSFIVLSTIKRMGTRKDGKKVVGGYAHTKPFKMLQPVMPYPVSVGLCFIPGVPLPDLAESSVATKVLFALVSGWMADKVFQLIKGVLEKSGVRFPEKEA